MTRGGHLVTVGALPARREDRELGAPPTMIGLRAGRPFVRGFVCLLLGVLLSIATVAAAHFWLQHQVAAATPRDGPETAHDIHTKPQRAGRLDRH